MAVKVGVREFCSRLPANPILLESDLEMLGRLGIAPEQMSGEAEICE
jgi:hypothetical protein